MEQSLQKPFLFTDERRDRLEKQEQKLRLKLPKEFQWRHVSPSEESFLLAAGPSFLASFALFCMFGWTIKFHSILTPTSSYSCSSPITTK